METDKVESYFKDPTGRMHTKPYKERGNNKSRIENRTKIKYRVVESSGGKMGKGIKINKGEESQVHI